MTETSALHRVGRALEQAQATQGALNIFTFIDVQALETAAGIDSLLARGDSPGLLSGVPVALKDLIDQQGRVTTCGSAFYRHHADESATVVDRLENAGAVVIGRTGLHEFAFGFSSENPHFGPVRNPWDPSTSTGGSSGGSAAAVAAGITPLAVGTDTGGSIRVPAALCGCFGLKTTHGRVPLQGVFPLVPSLDTVGPLADSMPMLELGYRVMAGDRRPLPAVRPLRIGIPQPWVDARPVEGGVKAGFDTALRQISEIGHDVDIVSLPGVIPPGKIAAALAEEVMAVHREFRDAGRPYGEDVAARLDAAEAVSAEERAQARVWQLGLRRDLYSVLEEYDFLVTPTVPVTRKVIGEELIGGAHYRSVLSWFSALVNHALLPAIALPLTDTGDPPASLQVIGSLGSELSLIALGHVLEQAGIVEFRTTPIRTL